MTTKQSSGNKTGLILGIVGGIIVLALVAVAASTVPALRAVRVSPVLAIRSE